MRHNILPIKLSICPHCAYKDLSYYHEDGKGKDLYYCPKCYGIVSWDGNKVVKQVGEAYPNRENRFEKKEVLSKCCQAEMSGGVQCLTCGACGLCGGPNLPNGECMPNDPEENYKNNKNKNA